MASKFLRGSPIKLVLEAPKLEDLRSERFGCRNRWCLGGVPTCQNMALGAPRLDPIGLDKQIANVSEGFPKQGNMTLEAPK